MKSLSTVDQWLSGFDRALKTLSAASHASRPSPARAVVAEAALAADERRLSGALMRVNHVGEVCAQALYQAQALSSRNAVLKQQFMQAAAEEVDHLAWTEDRLQALGARPSLLNPLWYAGAFGIGMMAGRLGDAASLGFVVETERQVEEHLASHLVRLPSADVASRAVVEQMKDDEAQHAVAARKAGAAQLPWAARMLMRTAARVMTTTAHYI